MKKIVEVLSNRIKAIASTLKELPSGAGYALSR